MLLLHFSLDKMHITLSASYVSSGKILSPNGKIRGGTETSLVLLPKSNDNIGYTCQERLDLPRNRKKKKKKGQIIPCIQKCKTRMHIGDIFFLRDKSTHTGIRKESFQNKEEKEKKM